jgi:hypothetical protein
MQLNLCKHECPSLSAILPSQVFHPLASRHAHTQCVSHIPNINALWAVSNVCAACVAILATHVAAALKFKITTRTCCTQDSSPPRSPLAHGPSTWLLDACTPFEFSGCCKICRREGACLLKPSRRHAVLAGVGVGQSFDVGMLPNAHHTHAQNQPAPLAVLDHGNFWPPRVLVLTGTVMNMRAFVKDHCRNCVCTPRCWPLQNAHNMHVTTHSHTTILQRSLCVNVASLATMCVCAYGHYDFHVRLCVCVYYHIHVHLCT